MRLTTLLVFLPVVFSAPIPTFTIPGTPISTSSLTPKPSPYPSGLRPGDAQTVDEGLAKLEQGRADINQGFLQAGVMDLRSAQLQAIKSKNTAVESAVKVAESDLTTASKALIKVFNDIDAKKKPDVADQKTAAKGVLDAQGVVEGLEKLIVNEDKDLSKFIAGSVDDVALIRKGMEAVLAFSNLTFPATDEPQGQNDKVDKNAGKAAKLQQGRDEITEGLGKAQSDIDAVFNQAGRSGNTMVQNGAAATLNSLGIASSAIFNMLNSTGSNIEPSRNDLAKAAKGIASAQDIVEGLEKAIVTKDPALSKLITSLVADVALIRKGAEDILSTNDLTFDTVGEPQGDGAAVGDIAALEKASISSLTDIKSSLKDFGAVVAQAEETKNDDVATRARELRTSLQFTLKAAQTIADAVRSKSGFLRNDEAILAKGITTAKSLADNLEAAIENKDELLSEFITCGIENLDLARKDINAILASNNFTVDNVGEPTEDTPSPTSTAETLLASETPSIPQFGKQVNEEY